MLKFLVDEDLPRSTATQIIKALEQLTEDYLYGNVVIIEPTKIRIRRHKE
jgi:hypothetical protein